MTRPSPRLSAILLAVFVTVLWSTSWVLIKLGLRSDLPPITFAGLRYSLAFLCLAPFVLLRPSYRAEVRSLRRKEWGKLILLGLLTYTFTQTAQYAALAYLPAAMTSLILNLSSPLVAITGVYLLRENPSSWQWAGIALTMLGVGLYFLPMKIAGAQWAGMAFALACLAGNVPASLFGRRINRSGQHSPLLITFISMGIGSLFMLVIGLLTQGLGRLSVTDWLITIWLAVINTALAFTLWNSTLRTLTAAESSVINNLMMPQIAILAWLFLRESLTAKEIAGLVLVGAGVLLVQLRRAQPAVSAPARPGSSA